MKIIWVLLIFFYAEASDYTKLESLKKAYQSNKSIQREKTNKVQIWFDDLNRVDFSAFEEHYTVKFLFCLGSNMCIFQNNSHISTQKLLENLKKNKEIRSLQLYKNYKMQPF